MYKVKIRKKYPTSWGLAPGWWEVRYLYRYRTSDQWSFLYQDVCDSWQTAMYLADRWLGGYDEKGI